MAYYAYRSINRNKNRRPAKSGRGQYIDPSRFIKAARPVEEVAYEPTHLFDDFLVNDILKTNIRNKGFTKPTPIQDQTIPLGLEGKDIIGIANTGTGKTTAFGLPVLHRLMTDRNSKVLIVAPTRELAQQIEAELKTIAKGSGLFGAVLIGGSPMGPQLRDLKHNPPVVIGTPGRIKDHMDRGTLQLGRFNMVVLDEVDRMLDMGFVDDVRTILAALSAKRQSLFFSATMDARIKNLIHTFANEPVTVSIKTGETTDSVHQDVVRFGGNHEKMDKLHDILITPDVNKVIVFDETQRNVEKLGQELHARGFKVDAIHGGKTQGQRQRALARFKDNQVNILVATDVAARGIDVKDVTHVINYTQPQTYEDYVHRIGRAGRAGKIGYALTFVGRG